MLKNITANFVLRTYQDNFDLMYNNKTYHVYLELTISF